MGSKKKIELMKFLAAFLAAILLVTFIPFDVISVFAEIGNDTYDIIVSDSITTKRIGGATVELISSDGEYNQKITTNGQGVAAFDLAGFLESKGWPNMPFSLTVSYPGTGYKTEKRDIKPNYQDHEWQNEYRIKLVPTDFKKAALFELKDITYDTKSHAATEFINKYSDNTVIEFEGSETPSFTDAGSYNVNATITSKGYYDFDNNSESTHGVITLNILKAERPDFKFLVSEPDVLKFPNESFFRNSANSSYERQSVKYESSNPNIAAVDEETGDVDFLDAGTVTVTATMAESDNYKSSTNKYTISAKRTMKVSFDQEIVNVSYGEKVPLNSLDFDSNPPKHNAIYSLAGEKDSDIAKINSQTGSVTPKKAGTVHVKVVVTADNYFDASAEYTLNIIKGKRTLKEYVNGLEYNKSYDIFGEKFDSFDFDYAILEGDEYVTVDKQTGKVKVIKAGGHFEIRITVPENEQYDSFIGVFSGDTVQTVQPVDFSNPQGYGFTSGNDDTFNLDLNGQPHYGAFSASWDNKGTDKDVIESITLDPKNSNTVVVKYKPGMAQKQQQFIKIEITFSGNVNYKEKTITSKIGLEWDTKITNVPTITSDKPKGNNGYYVAPVKVSTADSSITFLDPDGNQVRSYTLDKNGDYGIRTTYFFKTYPNGKTYTNAGTIGDIHIDQTAPTGFSVNIVNPDKRDPFWEKVTKIITVFASKELDVTVKVTDPDSGFDKMYYSLNGETWQEVNTFTSTDVVGSKEQVVGNFKIPVNKKGKLQVWVYDRAGNCISTHNEEGKLIAGTMMHDGAPVSSEISDVHVIVDNTAPVVNVSFDNNSVSNERFFNKKRTATIKVTEDNYFEEDVKIEVFKDNSTVAVPKEDLKKYYDRTFNTKNKMITLTFKEDGEYTFKVSYTDRSGNVGKVYYGSSAAPNSFVIDTTKPVVTVDFDKSNAQNQYYFSLAKSAKINIKEKNYSSDGLNLDVQMTKGQTTTTVPKSELILKETGTGLDHTVEISFTVDAAYNFKLGFTDLAGNEAVIDYGGGDKFHFVIDTTLPVINVKYSNNKVYNEKYFNEGRTATISVTERNFDKNTTFIVVNGEYIVVDNWVQSGDTYSTTYNFPGDKEYKFNVECTDKAGNKCPGVVFADSTAAANEFVVDTTKPDKLDIKINGESVLGGDSVVFDKFYKDTIKIELDADCNISGEFALQYQMVDKVSAYSVDNGKWVDYDRASGITVSQSKKFILYFRAIDNASNVAYVNSTGVIVDNKEPEGEKHAPDIDILLSQANAKGYYNGNVTAKVSIVDPAYIGDQRDPDGFYSGLKEVTYKIYTTDTDAVESGTLLDISKDIGKTEATFDDDNLASKWTRSIVVDAEKFNSNNVIIQVEAVDNAGNVRITRTKLGDIKIDTTKPRINVSYNNNNVDLNEYFKADRVATISVTERNFDPEATVISLTSSTGKKPSVSEWVKKPGQGNGDDTVWTATVTFNSDGDYTFDITGTDLAGNVANPADYGNSAAPKKFTIDKTAPKINVSYNNNSAVNGNYYKDYRTATITIVEHNFSADRVKISIKATDDGSDIAAPAVSKWTSNGDTHTVTIKYNKDGKYTFRISAKDKAGNDAAAFADQTFYIDTTAPVLSITGVKDNSAYSGNLNLQILYSDTNYSPDLVNITFAGANRGKLEPDGTNTAVHNGNKFVFNEFAKKKEIDDIYTLSVTITDLAGNVSTQKLTFSVNRFGSAYGMSDATKAVIGKYIKDPVDIVVTEVNPNDLTESKVTLYKNNNPIILKEGVDYDVKKTGGNGEWNEYTYVIHSDNFKEDGVYSVIIYSVDKAGNTSENSLDTKNAAIQFGVDNSDPNIVVSNLQDSKTYATELYTVKLLISDNLVLDGVDVYLDDYNTPYKSWTGEEVAAVVSGAGDFSFDINDASNGSHKVKIVATDAAGNKHEIEVSNFYVTTNLFVRYYTNTPLFIGSIIGLLVIIALAVFIVVIKRKYGRR